MSLLSTLKSLVSVDPVYRKAAPTTTELFGPLGQRNADWSGVATSAKVRDVWGKCATAFACITLLADAVAESPLRVYRTIDGELEEDPNHRTRTLLANPNPVMSEAEFISLVVMTMGLHGYGAVEKVRSGAGLPVQLWPLRPDWLKREYVGSTGATQWVYRRPGADPYPIADEDVLIIPYYHDPSHLSLGLSPLHIVAREVGIDVALTDLLKVFIDNGGIPPWVVKLSGDVVMDQAEADTFREKWRQRYGGSRAYGEIGLLLPGMDLQKVGDSIGDMAWPDLRGLTEMKIAQAFRVPADLIQARDSMASGSLTTTEMDGSMSFLQNHGAQPLRTRIDGAFSRGLLPDFGSESGVVLEFDTSGILALQEDEDARHNRVRADWQAGLITLNEARRETDRTDLGSDGEVLMQTFTTMLVPVSGLAGGNGAERAAQGTTITPRAMPVGRESGAQIYAIPETATGEPFSRNGQVWCWSKKHQRILAYRDLKALSPGELEVRASVLQTTRRERDKLAEIGARALRKFWKAQGNRIVGTFHERGAAYESRDYGVDWDEEARRLWDEVFAKFYGSVGESAFGTVSAVTSVSIAWDLANPNIGRIMDELGKRIVGITDTTRQDVIKVITDGQAEGLNLQQISDNLTGMFEETYKGRALTIARTETAHSYSTASLLGYRESGVVSHVEFDDNPDHDDDPLPPTNTTCADRAGLVVPVEDAQPYVDSAHVNCVLATIPILATPLGEG